MPIKWNSTEHKPRVTDFGYEIHYNPYAVVTLVHRDDKGKAVYVSYLSKDDLTLMIETMKDLY